MESITHHHQEARRREGRSFRRSSKRGEEGKILGKEANQEESDDQSQQVHSRLLAPIFCRNVCHVVPSRLVLGQGGAGGPTGYSHNG